MTQGIEITLLRHGRSLADDEQCLEGRYDSPLTEVGISQAKQRLDYWISQGRTFDLILSSSLQRASKVAEIIASGLNIPIEIDRAWMEKDNGSLAGLPFTKADELYPKADFVNPFEPYVVSAGDGESEIEMHCRALLALQSVIRRGAAKTLVVSHGKFITAAMNAALGIKPSANSPSVIYAVGDLSFIDLVYYPHSDIWLVKEIGHLQK